MRFFYFTPSGLLCLTFVSFFFFCLVELNHSEVIVVVRSKKRGEYFSSRNKQWNLNWCSLLLVCVQPGKRKLAEGSGQQFLWVKQIILMMKKVRTGTECNWDAEKKGRWSCGIRTRLLKMGWNSLANLLVGNMTLPASKPHPERWQHIYCNRCQQTSPFGAAVHTHLVLSIREQCSSMDPWPKQNSSSILYVPL